jgi:molybdopterin molybdotransferase
MIPFEQALGLTLAETIALETEPLATTEALGRFLAKPVSSPVDAPPFDKAAMDGYAVSAEEHRESYHLRETISAGDSPGENPLADDEAAKIMTGAPLPPGATRVIRVEFTTLDGDEVRVNTPEPYANVIRRGENIRSGDHLLSPGRLGPKEIGCLAAAGITDVEVFRRVRMGVISTGDELREAGSPLEPGQIYDSNGPQLEAQIANAGGSAVRYGIVRDEPTEHRRVIDKGLAECDMLLLTGGVSMGDFDYVPRVLEEAGVNVLYHRVRVKPGRPTLFGRTGTCLVFGLPGNPVSTFVIFEVLVRPLLHALQNAPAPGTEVSGRLSHPIRRKDIDRAEFYPAMLDRGDDGNLFTPVRYGGSSHLNALAAADALVGIPAGVEGLEAGTRVTARLI